MSRPRPRARVRKRNGSFEPVTVEKIIRAVERSSVGLASLDPMRVQDNRWIVRWLDHQRIGFALDPDRRIAHRGGARVFATGPAPAHALYRKGSSEPKRFFVLAVSRGRIQG